MVDVLTGEAILAKARSYLGQFHDGPDVPILARAVGQAYPEMASYAAMAADNTPWCGIFVAYVLMQLGIRPVFGATDTDKWMWAQAWKQAGVSVADPQLGDILVFHSHVAFYAGTSGDYYKVVGGNQSDGVTETTFHQATVDQIRRVTGNSSSVVLPPSSFAQSGKGSWYSQFSGKYQWVDTGDQPGSAALGVPDDAQGISFYDHSTLGKWFEVKAPNGNVSIEQQTDIGPNPRTGRSIDISAAAAERFGYSPRNFPTDSIFSWRSINPPAIVAGLSPQQQATRYRDMRSEVVTMPDSTTLPTTPTAPPQFSIDWAKVEQALEKAAQIAGGLQQLQQQKPGSTPTQPTQSTQSIWALIGPAIAKALPMLGLQGSVWGSVIMFALQAMNVLGPTLGTNATTTGTTTGAVIGGTFLSSAIAWVNRLFQQTKGTTS